MVISILIPSLPLDDLADQHVGLDAGVLCSARIQTHSYVNGVNRARNSCQSKVAEICRPSTDRACLSNRNHALTGDAVSSCGAPLKQCAVLRCFRALRDTSFMSNWRHCFA